MSEAIELQLLIMFYKGQLKEKPDCIATKALLNRSRKKLKIIKDREGI